MTTANRRPGKSEYYLSIAEAVALRSSCVKHKYGAVIVKDDRIVSTGYNGAPRGEPNCCDAGKAGECYKETHLLPADARAAEHGDQYGSCPAVHAETNAIIQASGRDLLGAALYLSCLDDDREIAPCNFCAQMIKNAGITRLVIKPRKQNLAPIEAEAEGGEAH